MDMKRLIFIFTLICALSGCGNTESDVQNAYNEGREAGYNKGFSEGFEQGKKEGYQEGFDSAEHKKNFYEE